MTFRSVWKYSFDSHKMYQNTFIVVERSETTLYVFPSSATRLKFRYTFEVLSGISSMHTSKKNQGKMPQAGKSGAGPKVQVRSTSEARRPHLYQQECTGQKILSLHRRKFREKCHFWVLPYHWVKSGKVAILEFCFLLRRKFRWKCHFRVLASHSEENSGKNAISEFCFYSEEKSGENAIQCFASYSEENSGENAISDFCFLLRRKFRGKCHFKV